MVCGSRRALGSGGFDPTVSLCLTSSPDISAVPSSATTSAPPSGIPRCNTAGSTAADETTDRILSADNALHAVGELIAFAAPLDFRDGLLDSREGPWEVMTPRSSCPGEEFSPLRGVRPNLRLKAQSTVAQACLLLVISRLESRARLGWYTFL
jgi:hypothetical protein